MFEEPERTVTILLNDVLGGSTSLADTPGKPSTDDGGDGVVGPPGDQLALAAGSHPELATILKLDYRTS